MSQKLPRFWKPRLILLLLCVPMFSGCMYNFLFPNKAAWRYHVPSENPVMETAHIANIIAEATGRKVKIYNQEHGTCYWLGRVPENAFDSFMFGTCDYYILIYPCPTEAKCFVVSINRVDGGHNDKVEKLQKLIEKTLKENGYSWDIEYWETRLNV